MSDVILETDFSRLMKISLPIIVAPMFLVSNEEMLIESAEAGAIGVAPSLNFRPVDNFVAALKRIRSKTSKPYGINLIAQKTNPFLTEHLKICLDQGVPFFITSLGNPKQIIEEAHKNGAKVFCDVIGHEHAKKVVDLGADGLIAVCAGAGGHAGPTAASVLVPMLKREFKIPVVAAGGIVDGYGLASMLSLGASGVSVGTRFIASREAPVTEEYKQAILKAHAEDIVYTTRLSGTPCSVINTPFVQKMGTDQNWLEKKLNRSPRLKKYFKMLVQYRGMKLLEKAAFQNSYRSVWCAGQSSELIHDVKTIREILKDFLVSYEAARTSLPKVTHL